MRKRWILIGVSALILLFLFLRGVVLELSDGKEQELPGEYEEPEQRDELRESVFRNVWILKGSGHQLRFLTMDGIREMEAGAVMEEELTGTVADLYVRNEVVYRIVCKPETITGRVLMLDEEAGCLELEGYDTLELDPDVMVYDLRTGGNMETEDAGTDVSDAVVGSLSQIVLGYDAADYVVAEGKVCAVLLCREIVPENIRVLIKTTGYGDVYHEMIRLKIQGKGKVVYDLAPEEEDKATDQAVNDSEDRQESASLKDGKTLKIQSDSKYLRGGRCVITAKEGILVESVERGLGNPVYYGSLEIIQTEEGLLLINEVDLETYLKGVLPSEMPTSFPEEALRTQAVCARSYACRQLLESGCRRYGAHVDDSVSYQVYQNAAGTEKTDAAVDATVGQILTWESEPALTSYFSTSYGMTSPAHKVWIGMDEVPYLTGGWQGEEGMAGQPGQELSEAGVPDLSQEEAFREFLMEEADGYEVGAGWYRWKTTISAENLKKSIDRSLKSRYGSAPELVKTWQNGEFVSVPVDTVGDVQEVKVITREREGLVTALEIVGSKNRVRVYGEYNIRTVLAPLQDSVVRKDGSEIAGSSMLPSAYMMLEEERQGDRLVSVTIRGGGYGHGVGMSQYGAKALAEKGEDYRNILLHYYPGTELTFLY